MVMFGSRKLEGKCERKKIERKSRRKEKVKENKKIDLNLINYFYMFFQTHFAYFSLSYKD